MILCAFEVGCTVSGEHGIGAGEVCHLVRVHDRDYIAIQEVIRQALDPDNNMNPGYFYPS
ncbi:uncharacterized protein JKF63_07936 [Porcisia hertigi]|uniref:FAD-binding oxidoreductase/transferase type 4 C-terminal domain-containing protein n=1 Tax=Porcisia hertigi TaxID=2761500 RepID=A0A836H7R5_9TRYP|nr:hypothetical protein JKF63_07936 [Porcisia hertigi]